MLKVKKYKKFIMYNMNVYSFWDLLNITFNNVIKLVVFVDLNFGKC